MSTKFKYWDELFKGLINTHMGLARNYDPFCKYFVDKAYLALDHPDFTYYPERTVLEYIFCSENGNTVIYKVNRSPYGAGSTTVIASIGDSSGKLFPLKLPCPEVEQILQECYIFAVKAMGTLWY